MRFAPSALLFKLRALRAEALSAKMIPEQLLYLRKRGVQYTKAVLLLGVWVWGGKGGGGRYTMRQRQM